MPKPRPLTQKEKDMILSTQDLSVETLHMDLGDGISARVEIAILVEPIIPTPNERTIVRPPTARELHRTAELLHSRRYSFHPIY